MPALAVFNLTGVFKNTPSFVNRETGSGALCNLSPPPTSNFHSFIYSLIYQNIFYANHVFTKLHSHLCCYCHRCYLFASPPCIEDVSIVHCQKLVEIVGRQLSCLPVLQSSQIQRPYARESTLSKTLHLPKFLILC